jgi:hypothetical protein
VAEVAKMTDVAMGPWVCPKDGTGMSPIGRRSGAWRCPACKAVFLDVEAMRRKRGDRPAVVPQVVVSVAMSLVMTVLIRRFLRRLKG